MDMNCLDYHSTSTPASTHSRPFPSFSNPNDRSERCGVNASTSTYYRKKYTPHHSQDVYSSIDLRSGKRTGVGKRRVPVAPDSFPLSDEKPIQYSSIVPPDNMTSSRPVFSDDLLPSSTSTSLRDYPPLPSLSIPPYSTTRHGYSPRSSTAYYSSSLTSSCSSYADRYHPSVSRNTRYRNTPSHGNAGRRGGSEQGAGQGAGLELERELDGVQRPAFAPPPPHSDSPPSLSFPHFSSHLPSHPSSSSSPSSSPSSSSSYTRNHSMGFSRPKYSDSSYYPSEEVSDIGAFSSTNPIPTNSYSSMSLLPPESTGATYYESTYAPYDQQADLHAADPASDSLYQDYGYYISNQSPRYYHM